MSKINACNLKKKGGLINDERAVKRQRTWMETKVINDCVHGHMSFPKLLMCIIDTPEFQRLRNIKQLGLTSFVYPAATNNRFEHSLGTCHLAEKLMDSLVLNGHEIGEKEKWCVKIAALCHDLGHGPFSHTWEKFLRTEGVLFRHEDASLDIFDKIVQYPMVVEQFRKHQLGIREIEMIKSIIKGDSSKALPEEHFLFQIVSNKDYDMDVDKWEYIARDSLMLNQPSSFHYQRLLKFCIVAHVEETGKMELCFRDKEVRNILDMFVMRATLHSKAYQHHAVQVIESMMIDALKAAHRDDPELNLTSTKAEDILLLTDHIYYVIRNDKRLVEARHILNRIETRKLYKVIHVYDLESNGINSSYNITPKIENAIKDKVVELYKDKLKKPEKGDLNIQTVNITLTSKDCFGGVSRIMTYPKRDPRKIKKLDAIDHPFSSCITRNVLRKEILVIYRGQEEIEQGVNIFDAVDQVLRSSQALNHVGIHP